MSVGFSKRVVHIGRSHTAVDFSLSNCTLIEVSGGAVLIDALPGPAAAREVKAELEKLGPLNLKGIIYTHSHPDHIRGSSVFHSPGVPVWAQEQFHSEMRHQQKLAEAYLARGFKQFGCGLDASLVRTNGIGPPLRMDSGAIPQVIPPTETFGDRLDLDIGDRRFELHHAPGETHDHLFVWLPDDRMLLAGDNLYRAFPNLYAIRGVPPRPVEEWINSLERMRDLAAEHLILGHTEPVTGADTIRRLLTDYRDAIAFIHDSVVRMTNQGKTPDEMVSAIRLPDHLRNHPYLVESYGTLAGSIRGIYAGYIGWFDGNATNLEPLGPADFADRLVPRLGGKPGTISAIDDALEQGDARWAAWLADLLLTSDPGNADASSRKAAALRLAASVTANPLLRCWYLSDAASLEGAPPPPRRLPIDARTVAPIPIGEIIGLLRQRVRPERTAKLDFTVGFEFTDTGRAFTFVIRRGVGEVRAARAEQADLIIRATEEDFKLAFVVRRWKPWQREFRRRIKFEVPRGGLLMPLRKLRRLLLFSRILYRPSPAPSRNREPKRVTTANDQPTTAPPPAKLGFFKARVWQGMTMSVWLRHLWRNRFAVSPRRIPQALRLTLFAAFGSLFHLLDRVLYSGRVTRTPLAHPPLFVLGHWRTGTTLLHELLALDDRLNAPTSYQCMAPLHFLVSGSFVPKLLRHLLPDHRPMDNMPIGFDSPQEDEIALCNMGLPSPYSKWLFPNNLDHDAQYLDLVGLSEHELKRWGDGLKLFLRRVAYRDPRRIVLKSPTHTARLAQLERMFLGSQFIHIVRDPFVVFQSTAHTWRQLWSTQGYQTPSFEHLDDYVFTNFERMYKSFEDACPSLGPRRLYELRYEDLVHAPVEEMRKLYAALELGDFERVRPALERYVLNAKGYRVNRYQLTDDLRRRVAERWARYIRRYGYDTQPAADQQAPPVGEASGE